MLREGEGHARTVQCSSRCRLSQGRINKYDDDDDVDEKTRANVPSELEVTVMTTGA